SGRQHGSGPNCDDRGTAARDARDGARNDDRGGREERKAHVPTISTSASRIVAPRIRAPPVSPTTATTREKPEPLRSGGLQLRVCGRRQDAERVERPVAQPRATDHVTLLNRPEDPRVRGVHAMVAHHEQLTRGDDPRRLVAGDERLLAVIDVRLVQLDAVDIDAVIPDFDGVAADADDALDEGRAVARGPSI